MIKLEKLSYRYPTASEFALREVDLSVPEGAFVLLVGGSGAGKSTLLRAIAGLVPHFYGGEFGGRVLVDGVDTLTVQPQQLGGRVGFVFQDPEAQAVTEEVEGEIAFGMENLGLDPALIRRRLEELLHQLDLDQLRTRAISSLSGGERQRLAIAAALAMQPAILVLDEPTSQLDPQSAEEVLTLLQKLNSDLGMTIILSEHRLERVVQYADRLLYMAAGRIVADGPPREALAQVPLTPPLLTLAKRLGWQPLPLTVREARPFARSLISTLPAPASGEGAALFSPTLPAAKEGSTGLREVWFGYGRREVLRGVSLDIQGGAVLAIIGRNGGGKTTLLKLLIGLLRPQRGDVRVLGRNVAGLDPSQIAQHVGYVPQNPASLLFADTVADELRFTLRGHKLAVDEARITDLLIALGLSGLADRYPRDLSIGQQQRVAIAALLVADPALVLLDEPTRGLDYESKAALVAYLRWLRTAGRAVVLVTHDVELVAEVADRVALLAAGEIAVDGPTRAVLSESLIFSSQIGKLTNGRFLTVAETMAGQDVGVQDAG